MWKPISEGELVSLITAAESVLSPPTLAFWEQVRLPPRKWALSPWGDDGAGFWVVAILGRRCIWYNDIEDGFNVSRYQSFGRIAEYWNNQAALEHCVAGLIDRPIRYAPVTAEPSGISIDEWRRRVMETAGRWQGDLDRPEQGVFEEREPLWPVICSTPTN